MENIIIIALLVIVLIFALKPSIKHLKGEGDCCGGSKEPKVKKKKLNGPKVGEKILHIEGMHCTNCQNRIEKALNLLDGVSAKVSLEKKTVRVAMDRIVPDNILQETVEKLDFKVTGIEEV